jgi:hypothetical protein
MAANYVRPFCRKQKNDFNDADAIAEAVTRPTVRYDVDVPTAHASV